MLWRGGSDGGAAVEVACMNFGFLNNGTCECVLGREGDGCGVELTLNDTFCAGNGYYDGSECACEVGFTGVDCNTTIGALLVI